MFGFLKDKIKKIANVFTKATTEEVKPEPEKQPKPVEPKKKPVKPVQKKSAPVKPAPKTKPEPKKVPAQPPKQSPAPEMEKAQPVEVKPEPVIEPEPQEKQGFFKRIFKKQETAPEKSAEPVEVKPAVKAAPPAEETTGFFGKLKAAIVTKKISREEYENIFNELEVELLENNVALEVVDKLREDLWTGISTERFNRFAPEKRVQAALSQSISELFVEPFDILAAAKQKDLYVICAIGINGSGKTTTLAKLAQYFKDHKLEPVLAAGDTFRAAAIQQLEEHANKIGVKIIKQQYGADAAAVAFDAIQYAKANKCRVVLIDTAGRLHSNTNLMEEMKKIIRVAKPDTTIFIGEATTGNDCVEQAQQFSAAVPIDGIVLSKVDVDERGGAALSISYVTRKPILFFGTGQTYKDLEPFNKEKILASLDLTN